MMKMRRGMLGRVGSRYRVRTKAGEVEASHKEETNRA